MRKTFYLLLGVVIVAMLWGLAAFADDFSTALLMGVAGWIVIIGLGVYLKSEP